jgi:hypothetical protein
MQQHALQAVPPTIPAWKQRKITTTDKIQRTNQLSLRSVSTDRHLGYGLPRNLILRAIFLAPTLSEVTSAGLADSR